MGLALRDLSEFKSCPNDTADEIHDHGELIGSTLWSLRNAIGAEQAEQIAFAALERFGLGTNHVEAAQLMIEAAESLDESIAQQTRDIFGMHGFGVCERSMPFVEFREDLQNGVLPHLVEGKQTAGLPGQLEYVPAYKQFYIAPEERQLS